MLLLTVGMAAFSAMYESCALMGMIDMYESLCSPSSIFITVTFREVDHHQLFGVFSREREVVVIVKIITYPTFCTSNHLLLHLLSTFTSMIKLPRH